MRWTVLHRTARLFTNAVQRTLIKPTLMDIGKHRLSEIQFLGLRYILQHGPVTGKELAGGLRITAAAATKLLDRLERAGLATRRQDHLDKRRVIIEITMAGEEMVRAIMSAEAQRFEAILARMETEDINALQTGLVAYLRAAVTDRESVERICLRCGSRHTDDCPGEELLRALPPTAERKTSKFLLARGSD